MNLLKAPRFRPYSLIYCVLVACVYVLAIARTTAQSSQVNTSDAARAADYNEKCSNGDMQGCANLAMSYRMGWGVSEDPLRANALFKKACDGGNAFGCRSVVADSLLPPTLTLVWLTGGEGRGRAGVYVETKGHAPVNDGTIVVAPNGREFDLSTPTGFINMALSSRGALATVVSLTGSSGEVTIAANGLSGFKPVSTKLEVREYLLSGGSKAGKLTAKGKITGWVATTNDGRGQLRFVLLPLEGFYEATGRIVKSISGTRKQEEVSNITGAVLGLLNGKLTLGLEGVSEAGQHVTYALPGWENEAFGGGVYSGQVLETENFGFAGKLKSSAAIISASP